MCGKCHVMFLDSLVFTTITENFVCQSHTGFDNIPADAATLGQVPAQRFGAKTMISRPVRYQSRLLAALAALVAVAVALSVHARYSDDSIDKDVMNSCKNFSVDGDGVLSMTCNVWSTDGDVYGTEDRTIDLDEKIGFDGSALQYNQSDFSGKCHGEHVNTWTTGQLTLRANCPLGLGGKTVAMRVDDMIYNEGGAAHGVTPGLYWRSTRSSD